jgi:hypothetical protein
MLVSSRENLRITQEQGFTVQGFKSRHHKKIQRMEPGDRLLYYLTGGQHFAAGATITSTFFNDHTPLWVSAKEGEDYPFRVHIRPDVVLEEAQFLDAREIGPRMEYVRKWPPEHWPLAFQGNLHLIPKADFLLIEEEMRKAAGRTVEAR